MKTLKRFTLRSIDKNDIIRAKALKSILGGYGDEEDDC